MTNSLSGVLAALRSLADELTIHRSFYRYCSAIEGERRKEREREREKRARQERDERRESRWRGTRELTAFITAFSPCHGLSLRHSLPAIERQAICTPSHPRRVIQARLAIRLQLAASCSARTSDWICATPSANYREINAEN